MRAHLASVVIGSLLLAAFPMTSSPAHEPGGGSRPLLVRTREGVLSGTRRGAVDDFLGIRYARPPLGPRRWRPPQPVAPWRGVVPATRYGNRCPALISTNGSQSLNEDCLFLNVQRPAGVATGSRRPVYVFIHGGGLVNGSSDQHDGSLIVQTNKIIVVTLNYRLGVFGFLGHPALTAEQGESGNYGFADQQAALRWVHDNIAAFGGDPGRVTIGGESAGGFSVCAHLAAPGSRGLFAAAMIQSGGCGSEPQAVADAAGVAVANRAGCTVAATVLPCLRAASVTDLLAAGRQLSPALVSGTPTLPLDPGQAVLTGRFSRVPVVFGANRDEARSFSMPAIGWSQAQYTGWVQATFGSRAASILTHYPWPATADKFTAAYLVAAIQTDSGAVLGIGGCATRTLAGQFADRVPTFVYEFANRTGPGLDPRLVGYQWGAGHAAELAYLWPSFDNGTPIAATFDAAERRLSGDMVRSWGAFVSYHLPFAWDLPGWPIYSLGHEVLSLRPGGHSTLITDATYSAEHQCGFWTGRSSG